MLLSKLLYVTKKKSKNGSLSSLQFKSLALMNSSLLFYCKNITFRVKKNHMEGKKKVVFIDMFAILNTAHTLPGKLYVESVECYSQVIQRYIKFEISFHP